VCTSLLNNLVYIGGGKSLHGLGVVNVITHSDKRGAIADGWYSHGKKDEPPRTSKKKIFIYLSIQ